MGGTDPTGCAPLVVEALAQAGACRWTSPWCPWPSTAEQLASLAGDVDVGSAARHGTSA